jgi:hypothetical protein
MAQEPPCVGSTSLIAPLGYNATIEWTIPDNIYIQQFRLRRSQTLAGSWGIWKRITDPTVRTFSFPVDGNYYYYLSAIYSLPQPDGTNKVVETEGSGQVKIVVQLMSVLPRTGWSVVSVDSQEVINSALNVFDGNVNTVWRTNFPDPLPHELVINLGVITPIGGFRYLPRQDSVMIGLVKDYEFYISLDGVSWPTVPDAKGTFDTTKTVKEVTFPNVNGQYIKFKILSNNTVDVDTSVAELNIMKVTNL